MTTYHCQFCGRGILDEDLHLHHPVYRSEGGTEVVAAHRSCHINHHSNAGDFRRWGREGGRKAAATLAWIYNLRFGNGAPNPQARLERMEATA